MHHATMETYEIFSLDCPVSASDLVNYRNMRLLALQLDPSSFGSTYENEVQFTEAQWRERLDSPLIHVLIARAGGGEWVGVVRMVAPGLPDVPGQPANLRSDFWVCGMWVHPEHRRNGVGKLLLGTGLRWVDAWADEDVILRDVGIITTGLAVHAHNHGAKRLYASAGFEELLPDEKGRIPMVRRHERVNS